MDAQDISLPVEVENSQPSKRMWGPWPTAGFGLVIGIVYFVAQALVAAVYAFLLIISGKAAGISELADNLRDTMGLLVSLVVIASAIAGFGMILIFIKARSGAAIAEYLGLRRISGKTILILLGVILGLAAFSDSISLLLEKSLSPEWVVNTYDTSVSPALLWIALLVFAPLFEEAFFHGFRYEGFRQSRIGVGGTIALTALFWALLHFQYDLYGIATIFVSGLILGIARFKTDSLWSTILMYAFMSLIAMVEVAININGLVG